MYAPRRDSSALASPFIHSLEGGGRAAVDQEDAVGKQLSVFKVVRLLGSSLVEAP